MAGGGGGLLGNVITSNDQFNLAAEHERDRDRWSDSDGNLSGKPFTLSVWSEGEG